MFINTRYSWNCYYCSINRQGDRGFELKTVFFLRNCLQQQTREWAERMTPGQMMSYEHILLRDDVFVCTSMVSAYFSNGNETDRRQTDRRLFLYLQPVITRFKACNDRRRNIPADVTTDGRTDLWAQRSTYEQTAQTGWRKD